MGQRRADRRPALRLARRLGELLGEAARGGGLSITVQSITTT